jgi:CoA-binding domain
VGSVDGPRIDDRTVVAGGRRRPRWVRQHVLGLVALDATAAIAATTAARYVRFGSEPAELLVRTMTIPYSLLAVAIVPTWLAVLAVGRCYDVGPFGTGVRLSQVVRAGANFMAVVAVAYFVLQVENLRRGFLAVAVVLAVVFSLGLRALAARWLRERRRAGQRTRRALVVGSRPTVIAVVRRLGLRRHAELRPVGACVPDPDRPLLVNERQVPVHGGLDDVLAAVAASGADAVVLTGSLAHGKVQRLAWALEGTGIDVFVVPALAHQAVELDLRPVAGLPLIYVNQGHVQPDLLPPVPVAAPVVPVAPVAPVAPPTPVVTVDAGVPAAPTPNGVAPNGVAPNGVAANGAAAGNGGAVRPPASDMARTNGRSAYERRPVRRPTRSHAGR